MTLSRVLCFEPEIASSNLSVPTNLSESLPPHFLSRTPYPSLLLRISIIFYLKVFGLPSLFSPHPGSSPLTTFSHSHSPPVISGFNYCNFVVTPFSPNLLPDLTERSSSSPTHYLLRDPIPSGRGRHRGHCNLQMSPLGYLYIIH